MTTENTNHYSPMEDARILEAGDDTAPRQVEVTIIRPCRSHNGLTYTPRVLREAVNLFEGAAAFADHPDALDETRAGGRSIRDLVGSYHTARYEEGHGIRAVLRFLPSAAWAHRVVAEVIRDRAAGASTPPVGISADLMVLKQPSGKTNGHRPGYDVLKIEAVNSCDIVFRPSAGGSFDRLLEAISAQEEEPLPPTDTEQTDQAVDAREPARALEAELAAVRAARVALCGDLLAGRLAASGLPAPAQDRVRARFASRLYEATELDAEITSTRDMLGALAAGGTVRGMGHARAQVGRSPRDNISLALERLFGLPLPDSASDVPRLSGIREAYIALTGDPEFTGRTNWERSLVREADEVTNAIMASVVGNVMNKKLVADYKGQAKWWAPLVSVVDLRDLKLQTRILLNDFESLADVAENGPYVNIPWGDTAETYSPKKVGSLVYVTMEMIINDDVRSVVRIPTKLAKAAVATINEYLSALWTAQAGTGPDMADTFPVFDATHGSNLGTGALTNLTLAAAITNVRKHANSAAQRIGISPKFLLIPAELEWAAAALVNSTLAPGTANNDVNALQGIVRPIVVPQFTDADNWYLHPAPAEAETVEIGFLNGRQEPELLVQDTPNVGTVFTNDAITWKVRWIFGAAWLDWRGAYGAVVGAA